MSGDEIVAMLHGLKAQQDQMSSWAESVNSTLHSHADGLEGAHKEFVMIRGEIRQSAEAADAKTETIAQRIAELFSKTDELLGSIGRSESELRGLIDLRLTEIQARVADLEISGPSSGPPAPAAPPGLIAEGIKQIEARVVRLEEGLATVDSSMNNGMAVVKQQIEDFQAGVLTQLTTFAARLESSSSPPVAEARSSSMPAQGSFPQAGRPATAHPQAGDPWSGYASAEARAAAQQGGGPKMFNIGSPAPKSLDSNGRPRDLDDKVALNPLYKYDSAKLAIWIRRLRNYIIGVHPTSAPFLLWCESFQSQKITEEDVAKCALMMDIHPVTLSQRLWSWLQLTIQSVAKMETEFGNITPLRGAEVWRKFAFPVVTRSAARRYNLREMVNNPKASRGRLMHLRFGMNMLHCMWLVARRCLLMKTYDTRC
jgi:hypothetical protein